MKSKKTNNEKRILLYADFDCITGFAQVAKNLVDNWAKDDKLKITVFAINNHKTEVYQYKDNVMVIPALSTSADKKDLLCRIEFLNIMYKFDYDCIFILNDIEILSQMKPHLIKVQDEKKKLKRIVPKTIVYFPIDSEPKPSDMEVLSFFDEIVTYTEYAKAVMKPLLTEAEFQRIQVIPHGVDTDIFYPINMLDAEKENALGVTRNKGELPFIFGTVNRNSARKDLASLIIGFALFSHKHNPNAVLYLHCNPKDRAGIDIENLCKRVGLDFGENVITPEDFNENKGVSSKDLNLIYNSFDCFITTTTAEGWGLSITEAMAVEKLVVCPKHTSITEITNNGENTLNFMFSQSSVFVNDYEKIRYLTNPSEVATLMEVIYNLKNESEETQKIVDDKIENAYQKVCGLKWDKIAEKFKILINK